MPAQVRTTLVLREDLYQVLKQRSRGGTMSGLIEQLIAEHLRPKRRSLFGTMPRTSTADVRDHRDRV